MSFQLPPNANLSAIPAGTPPAGVVPNFEHPNGTLRPDILGVGSVMLVIAILSTGLATYNRYKKMRASDWSRIVGLVLTIVYIACIFVLSDNAVHQWDFPLSWYNKARNIKVLYVQTLFLGPSIFFAKLAILLLYLEVFNIQLVTKYLVWFGIVFCFCTYWTSVPLVSYYCAPHAGGSWDITTYANCAHTDVWGVVQGTLAVVLDIFIFFLPLPTVWSLQMTRQRKFAVLAVFGTAILGIVAALLALVYRVRLYNGVSSDFNWIENQLFICIIVENCIALFVSSSPAISMQSKALYASYLSLRSQFSSSRARSSKAESSIFHQRIPSPESGSVSYDENDTKQKESQLYGAQHAAARESV